VEEVVWHAGNGRRRPVRVKNPERHFFQAVSLPSLRADRCIEAALGMANFNDLRESLSDLFGMASESKIGDLARFLPHQLLVGRGSRAWQAFQKALAFTARAGSDPANL